MKTYTFSPAEFAKLEFLLASLVSFHHQARDEAELREFSRDIYPLLQDVHYKIVGQKIDDRQRDAISEIDPWDMAEAEAIGALTKIFSASG